MNIVDFCFCAVFKPNIGELRFISLEAQTVTEKQSSFKVIFITQIGHRPGSQPQIAPRAKRGLTKKKQGRNMITLGPHYDADATKVVQCILDFPAPD